MNQLSRGDAALFLLFFAACNLVTFFIYGWDKHCAKKKGRRRVPEATLLLLAAFGGSIGAILGMRLFRHKTLHKKFRYGLPAILLVQLTLALWWLWPGR